MNPRYSIITPTILRNSLLKACESVNTQTCTDWEHIIMVDSEISSDLLSKISHPQRFIYKCEEPHNDYGHTCRHLAYNMAKGDYIYNLDDDNYLADETVLERMKVVTGPWALLPIVRLGERLFQYPPSKGFVDTGSILVKREIGQWPKDSSYSADWNFVDHLLKNHLCQPLGEQKPIMVMPISTWGGLGEAKSAGTRISIYTPTHSTSFLRELYESIKDQDFYEWIVVYNNGAAPIEFNDPRVKTHLLYKSPEKVGSLKSFACEQATGDILLELDHDDLLLPTAIEEVKSAFADPKVGFVYSNASHCFDGFKPYPRFDETFGWKYREMEYNGHKLDECISFEPTPEAVSRIWYAPDHLRAFRISDYRQAGGYDRTMRVLDDGDLMCRLYKQTKFKHIDKGLYIYRVHGQNSWLKYNKEIQDNVYRIYDKHIDGMVDKWADNNGLIKLEIGGPIPSDTSYRCLSTQEANSVHWNLPDNSVGVIRAVDSLAMVANPIQAMKEMSRVLVPGGWILCQVPSTDGRGAWQDPRHCSYWNENSFLYYTNRNWAQYINMPVRFQATRLYTTEKDSRQVCWTIAHLVNLKDGYRPAGQLEI